MTTIKSLGKWGEEKAVEFLNAKGYKILERNYKNKIGEIDLIALDQKTICFVEVKCRRSLAYGQPYESVTRRKQIKIAQVALIFLKYHFGHTNIHARFDVVSILVKGSSPPTVEHIPNAFDLTR